MIRTSTLSLLYILFILPVVTCFAQVNIDSNFKPDIKGGAARVQAVVLQPDGKILVGGDFEFANDQVSSKIARFNPDGTLDQSFQIGKGFDNTVETLALQPDGKILVGGRFSSYNNEPKLGLCRLHADGSLDTGFTAALGNFNGPVIYKIVVTPANKILIGGYFITFNGESHNNIVQLNPAGDTDGSFQAGAGPSGTILDMVLQPDNKITLVGSFRFYNGSPVNNICRIHPDGSVDTGFAPDLAPDININAIAIQADKKILIGGYNIKKNGSTLANGIARLNEDGAWDDAFTSNHKLVASVNALGLRADHKILVAGTISQVNGAATNLPLVLLNADGSVDVNYGTDLRPGGIPEQILPLADNEALLVGTLYVSPFTGLNDKGFGVVRLNATGRNVASFTNAIELNKPALLQAVAVQADGKILVAGDFTRIGAQHKSIIARLNQDGSLDNTFQVDLIASAVEAVLCQPDGKIIIGGSFNIVDKSGWYNLIRLNPDGSLDNTFQLNKSGTSGISCLTLQQDGKILVGGRFTNVNGADRSKLARFNADGTVDESFNIGSGPTFTNAGLFAEVLSLVVQSDKKILVGGRFEKFNNRLSPNLVRLNPDGSVDHSFSDASGSTSVIRALALQKDNKILVGGIFNSYQGANVSSLARLNPDGTVDNTFGPYIVGVVEAIGISASGKVLAGGSFRWVNGAPRNNIIRLNDNGATDIGFNLPEGTNGKVIALHRYPDEGFLIAGSFSRFNSGFQLNLVRLLPPSPAAPASVTASLTPPNQVELSWKDEADNELGFEIQRSLGADSGFVSIDTTAINATATTDKGLQGGTTYFYRVRAVNSGGPSAWSAVVSITTHKLDQAITFAPIPAMAFGQAPFALRAKASSGLPVAFTVVSGPATLADSVLTLTGVGTVQLQASQPGNDHFHAAAGVSQAFTVTEANATALRVSNVTTTGLTLEWEGTSPEFRVLRKTTASSASPTDGDVVYEGAAKTFTYSSGLTPNTAYFFAVYGKATGSASYSLNSKKIAVSTAAAATETKGTVALLAGETGEKAVPAAAAALDITQAPAADGYIGVSSAPNPTIAGALPAGVKSLVADKYWTVTGVGFEAITYTLTLDVSNMASVGDFSNILILYRANANEPWKDLLASGSLVRKSFQDEKLSLGNLSSFGQISFGVKTVTGVKDAEQLKFSLRQNYPNPFDKATTVQYDLERQAEVVLDVIDVQGKLVQQLVRQTQQRGTYQVVLNGAGLKSGSVYFIRLRANGNQYVVTAIYQ